MVHRVWRGRLARPRGRGTRGRGQCRGRSTWQAAPPADPRGLIDVFASWRGQLEVVLVLRLLLAGVVGVAGAHKLPDPDESVRAVRAYRLLPEAVVPTVGYGLPILEVGLALLLVAGLATRVAALISAALMLAFVVGIASAAARGMSIDCGCFGGGGEVAPEQTRYPQEIARDLALLAAALVVARWPRSRLSLDSIIAPDEGRNP